MLNLIKQLAAASLPAAPQDLFRRLIVFVRGLWLPVYRISRHGFTVVLIGHRHCDSLRNDTPCDPYLIYLLFGEHLEPPKICTVPWWKLNRAIRYWEAGADLIIFRHKSPRVRPWGAVARQMLNTPYHVAQSIALPPDADLQTLIPSSDIRYKVKKLDNAGYHYEVIKQPDAAQFEFFYRQMHRPYVESRHSGHARILPPEAFTAEDYCNGKELLFISKDGNLLAGGLMSHSGDSYQAHLLGVYQGNQTSTREQAATSLYWFSMLEAIRRGCATLHLGCSRAFLKNGVLSFKRKWGGQIIPEYTDPEMWLMPCGDRAPLRRFLEQNPFICEQGGRWLSLVFLGPHTQLNDKELAGYLRNCHYRGERLSTCVVLLSRQWAERAATVQNILNRLASSGGVLDLSAGSLTTLAQQLCHWQEPCADAIDPAMADSAAGLCDATPGNALEANVCP